MQQVWPRCCVFCGVDCRDDEPYVCDGCSADLPWLGPACPMCAKPLAVVSAVPCGECQRRPPVFADAAAAFRYVFPVDAAIRRFKFHRRLDYVPAFAAILVALASRYADDVDALLPVPLYWARQFRRGYNQALELCRPLAAATGWPVLNDIRRTRPTSYQSGLPAAERHGNLAGAFVARRSLAARHVLIVDDVMTTGATCAALAAVALEAGAGRVSVLALARAQPGLNA